MTGKLATLDADAVETRPPTAVELDRLRRVVDPHRVFIDG